MYDEMCLDTFLAQQEKLFREPVAESREEAVALAGLAAAALDVEAEPAGAVTALFGILGVGEEGADIAGMSSEDLAEQAEVFALPDGRYLIVEA